MQKVKCKFCKKQIEKAESYSPKERSYYCDEDCYKESLLRPIEQQKVSKVTCTYCGAKKGKNEAVEYINGGNRYVCVDHLELFKKTDEYRKSVFLNYVFINVANRQTDYRILQNQAEQLQEKYNMKWTGMTMTCEYWLNVANGNWNDQWYLGQIFPKYYDEARKYYEDMKAIEKEIESFEYKNETRVMKKLDKKNGAMYNININF